MRIAERNVVECQNASRLCEVLRSSRFLNRSLSLQYFVNSASCNRGTGQHHRHHGEHQERHDDHHCIGDECGHRANLHRTAVNAVGSNPDNQNRQAVHNQHHDRHHERHDPIDEQVGFGEVLVGSVEPFFFGFFSAECPNHG